MRNGILIKGEYRTIQFNPKDYLPFLDDQFEDRKPLLQSLNPWISNYLLDSYYFKFIIDKNYSDFRKEERQRILHHFDQLDEYLNDLKSNAILVASLRNDIRSLRGQYNPYVVEAFQRLKEALHQRDTFDFEYDMELLRDNPEVYSLFQRIRGIDLETNTMEEKKQRIRNLLHRLPENHTPFIIRIRRVVKRVKSHYQFSFINYVDEALLMYEPASFDTILEENRMEEEFSKLELKVIEETDRMMNSEDILHHIDEYFEWLQKYFKKQKPDKNTNYFSPISYFRSKRCIALLSFPNTSYDKYFSISGFELDTKDIYQYDISFLESVLLVEDFLSEQIGKYTFGEQNVFTKTYRRKISSKIFNKINSPILLKDEQDKSRYTEDYTCCERKLLAYLTKQPKIINTVQEMELISRIVVCPNCKDAVDDFEKVHNIKITVVQPEPK
ncbi:MAG: hypothetical protein Q4C49_05395 [Bacillota bacterium]|nr:hypothetical protein [Bacillota bacterium]